MILKRRFLLIFSIVILLCFSLVLAHPAFRHPLKNIFQKGIVKNPATRVGDPPSKTFVQRDLPVSTPKAALYVPDPNAADVADVYPDIELSPEIIDLAAEYDNSPLDIFYYVKENYDYEIYPLSMKGSRGVYYDKSGNDVDLASFLMALYRAAGIPCRYEYGIVQIPLEKARAWIGVNDDQILVKAFTDGGIGAKMTTINNNDYLEIAHVWVIAFVPYGNYRGRQLQQQENVWIHLDPSLKSYAYDSGLDVSDEYPFNPAIENSYYSQVTGVTPIDFYYAELQAYLDVNHPGETIDTVRREKSASLKEYERILPCNPPYRIKQIFEPIAALTDAHRTEVRVKLNNIGSFPTYQFTLPELYCKKFTISFDPATPADEAIIASYGGFFQTPPNLINVKPSLKLNGILLNPGETNACNPGNELKLSVTVTVSGFGIPTPPSLQLFADHEIYAGELIALHVDPPGTSRSYYTERMGLLNDAILANMSPYFSDEIEGEKLHITGIDYFNQYEYDSTKLGEIYHAPYMKLVSEAITGQRLRVLTDEGTGDPIGLKPVAQFIDVKHHVLQYFPASGFLNNYQNLFTLDRMQGSFYEHQILDRHFGKEAISTVDYFQNIVSQGYQIYEVSTSTELNNVFNLIDFDGIDLAEKNDFRDYFSWMIGFHGCTLYLPQQYFQKNNWRGYAWIEENYTDLNNMIANYALKQFWSVSASGGWTTHEIISDPNCSLDPGVSVNVETTGDRDIFYADAPFIFLFADVETIGVPTYYLQWTSDLPVDFSTTDSCCLTVYPSNITGRHWVEVTVTSAPEGCNTDTKRFYFTTALLETNDFCPPPPPQSKVIENGARLSTDCPIIAPIDKNGALQEDIVIPFTLDTNNEPINDVYVDVIRNNRNVIAHLKGDLATLTATWPKGSSGLVPGTDYKIKTYIDGLEGWTAPGKDLYVVRFLMKHGDGYERAIPEEYDLINFTSTVEPSGLKGKISFELFDISELPGICMNYPDPDSADTMKDYIFKPNQSGFLLSPDGQFIESEEPINRATIYLLSKDYAGYGKIRAFFEYYKNGQVCCKIQAIYNYDNKYEARIPFDYNPENFIADAWDNDHPENTDPHFDGEGGNSQLPGSQLGDGLSRFEEYRGFFIKWAYTRTNPNERDFFINDQNALGTWHYKLASGTEVHSINEREYVNTDTRIINFNNSPDTFSKGPQKGVRLYQDISPGSTNYFWGYTAPVGLHHGTPGQVMFLIIYPTRIQNALTENGIQLRLDEIIRYQVVHEMFHASDIPDHVPYKYEGCQCVFKDFGSMLYRYFYEYLYQPYWTAWDIPTGKFLCGEDCEHNSAAWYNINDNPSKF